MQRRHFIKSIVAGFAGCCLLRQAGTVLSSTVTVYKAQPRPGTKISRAAQGHYQNKFFPDATAVHNRKPHPGARYQVVSRVLTVPAGIDSKKLFNGRKDMDLRVAGDCLHLSGCGVSVYDIKKQIFI